MKVGSLKSSNKDGELVLIKQDNSKALKVSQIAQTAQELIENWDELYPSLNRIYQKLNLGEMEEAFAINQKEFHSPLPRCYQWLDGSAYIQHILLVRKARGVSPPEKLHQVPLMYQGLSHKFLGPQDPIGFCDPTWGLDFEGEIGIITGEVPQGTKANEAHRYIKLILLINDISLRGLIPDELKMGFGFLQGKPASSHSPFAITPDELGEFWRDGRVHLPLDCQINGKWFGSPNAGEMHFSFHDLIEHAAKTRDLSAGTIIGSGTVSNEDETKGQSCLAEIRTLEKIKYGESKTPFLKPGDTVKIEMHHPQKGNLFGTIFQKVQKI